MKIRLHIDKLRLQGGSAVSGPELAALIEEQLNGLIAAHGLPPGLADGGELRVGARTLELPPGLSRWQMGAEIARRLARDWYGPGGPILAPAPPRPAPEPVQPPPAAPEAPSARRSVV